MAVSMCSVTSPSTAISGTDMYLKRPLQSDMEETDFEPAVKMKCPPSGSVGGGGRRKQSKPIRVRSDMDPGPAADLVVDMKIPVTQSDSPAPETCREGPPVDTVDVDDQKAGLDPTDVVFPTKYHQLGSELKQEVGQVSYEDREGSDVGGKDVPRRSEMVDDFPLNELNGSSRHDADTKSWNQFPDSFYASSSGIPLPEPTNLSMRPTNLRESLGNEAYSMQTSSRPDMDVYRADMQEVERFWEGPDSGNGTEKSRIFHPDAYCDICDREFCNKYFLKTHRANKHGIYDGSSTDAGVYSSSAAVPPSMSGLVFSQATLPVVEPPPISQADRERATSSSVSCSSTLSLSGVLPIPQLPSNLGMLPYDDPPPPQPPPRSTDMEDYCDICQKHFCNKYYLRKHRQDVHGLSPGDVAVRRSQADFTRGSATSDVVESSTTPHFPLRVSSSASASTLPPPSALSNFPMFLPPPFGAPLPVVPPFLPGATGLGFGSLPFGADAAGTSSKLSTSSSSQSQPQQQLPGGTSSLLPGMLSPDAYIDMFRKEILGGYLMNNGDQRDVIAAVAAAAAAAAAGNDPSIKGPHPRLPISEPSVPDTPSNFTPDTFAEMLQRIGARIGKKNDVGALHHDLFRLNGLGGGPGAVRLPGSLTAAPSSSSSSSASSRLVDRVVCDLCNKEVCNKYFLKTHKMKVHGWDPNTSTVLTSTTTPLMSAESTSFIKSEPLSIPPQPLPPHVYLPLPTSQVDKPLPFPPLEPLTPKDAELQKMGIDPEAYCEICRKEFCSKYFLRTHRLNIHGIQDNNNTSSSSSPAVAGPSIVPSFASTTPQPFTSVILPPPAPPLVSLPSSLSTNCSSSYLFGSPGGPTIPADAHMADQRSWKWKEPVNATRVSCTLCNKVLCNKYFLRTHMAKRHGITTVDIVQPPTLPSSVIQTQTSQSHLSTNGIHQGSVDPASVDDERKEVECYTDKTAAVNLMLSGRTSADVQTVTARTWQVPSNDGESTSLHSDSTDSVVKCPLCTLALSDRDALLRHLSTIHHVDDHMSMSLITAVAQSGGSDSSGSPDGLVHSRPPTVGGSGGVVRRRRQFRCSFCRERFRTRVHCELHARAAHPRASGSCVEVTPAIDIVETQTSPPLAPPQSQSNSLSPVYATALDPNDSSRSQMLPFVLRELTTDDTEPRFSTALVYLPTFRPLTSPTNVTFTLTPIVQPCP